MTTTLTGLKSKIHIVGYGCALAFLLFLLRWLQFRFVIIDHSEELYQGVLALLFTLLGVWLATKLITPQKETVVVEKEVYVTVPQDLHDDSSAIAPPEGNVEQPGISPREMEVLALMAQGLSNGEIAERLYVSLNTVKTHTSNIFNKLDVKRRTQAVDKGRKLGLVA